ncbi:suppressor of tumorigenicity 14 protein homolog isoform X2 [Carcharodon carcharias]|uniref:suppressor of tumorigenicity 14 protein homolog isoform X2 n=1 Tax=Carcharodon carcharias TaxID=13397 RepID=UPI001B7E9DD0|nr:suppressor of tumorigenicity 14 protein homolog isoform X2 [Carcharodon carcharias]
MAEEISIPMTELSPSSNSTQEQNLLPDSNRTDQNERNSHWGNLRCRETSTWNACNKIICWKCKMWMPILFTVILITIIIVITGIKATSIDDDFIDPSLKIYGISRYYIGSMKISKYSFTPELIPQSKTYLSLSKGLKFMLCQLYNKSPALGYYFVDSGVFSFSNGTAYFWLQFAMPEEHDLLIKYTLSAEVLLNVLRQHLYTDRTGENIEVEPSSIALKFAKAGYVQSLKTGQCVFRVLLLSNEQTFNSLRLVNCSKNSSNYWLVQSESDHSIKTIISTEDEGSGCTGMNVAMYNTWVPGSKQIVSKFSQTGLPITSEVIVSGNVLLVTFSPRGECDLPKYSITFLQAPMTECGGVLSGTNGSFTSPSYSNNYQGEINCTWNLKVQEHFRAIIFFREFKLGGPSKSGESCVTDYLEVAGQRKLN